MSKVNDTNLFNNPMIEAAERALSPEEKEKYKQIGESMYGNMSFENSDMILNPDVELLEALAYIEEELKCGMHPSILDDNEKELLKDAYGEEWYTKWGYVKEDLFELKTLFK